MTENTVAKGRNRWKGQNYHTERHGKQEVGHMASHGFFTSSAVDVTTYTDVLFQCVGMIASFAVMDEVEA